MSIMLFIMIGSYFTISESVAITQGFKVASRLLLTVWIVMIYRQTRSYGFIVPYETRHSMAYLFYLLYLLLGFASFLWSSKVSYSLLQWFMTIQSLVFVYFFIKVLIAFRKFNNSLSFSMTAFFTVPITIIMIIFLIGAFVMPEVFFRSMRGGEETRLGGYLMNPNELGMLASMGASFALIDVLQNHKRLRQAIYMILCLIALAMTTSRSSFIGFFMVAFILIQKSPNRKLKMGIYTMMAVSVPFVLQYVIFKAGDVEEVLSMTGRLPFWKALINEGIVKEPFWGFGFQRIYYKDHFESVHTYAGHMTHNTFLQVLMNLGFVGFTIVLFQMFFTFKGVANDKDIELKTFFTASIIPLFINSFTEFGIFGQTNYAIFFYQFLIVLLVFKEGGKLSIYDRVLFNIRNKTH